MTQTCGKEIDCEVSVWERIEEAHSEGEVPVLGVKRSLKALRKSVFTTELPKEPIPGTDIIYSSYHATIREFLDGKKDKSSILANGRSAIEFFDELRSKTNPEGHFAVDLLSNWCDQRRQFNLQRRFHFWLHSWLWLHLPLSIALLIVLIVHIFVAMKYTAIFSFY